MIPIIKLSITICLVAIIMMLRFRIIKLLYPLIREVTKKRPLLKTKELTRGINYLQTALGMAMIVILLTILQYDIFYPSIYFDIANIIALMIIVLLCYEAIKHINMAFLLEEHVKKPRKKRV